MITSCTTQSYLKHLLKPFCSVHPSQAKVAKIFLTLGLVLAGLTVYRLLSQRSIKPLYKDRIAEVLDSEEQVQTLKQISGVPVINIEQRAFNREESSRNFLNPTGSLLDSLKLSWAQAKKMGITHIKVADILDKICQLLKSQPDGFKAIYPLNLDTPFSKFLIDKPQSLNIKVFKASMDRHILDKDIFRPDGVGFTYSTIEIEIENLSSGSKIIWTPIRGDYIRKYGFYSLGIEFVDLVSVLTGTSKEQLDCLLKIEISAK